MFLQMAYLREELGLSEELVQRILMYSPSIMSYNPETIKAHLEVRFAWVANITTETS